MKPQHLGLSGFTPGVYNDKHVLHGSIYRKWLQYGYQAMDVSEM